ncbi:hypothetical protein B0H16DRAFT_1522390 [Mycena metata]|uniref:F-box domain-containing protein n=1 Tax=Mycena metata TaxID=1033252 RepID=A0AAD7JL03_9AGAR|nr:hypothetical protein B0H16DRAFT_1522390 [Mycena metata]
MSASFALGRLSNRQPEFRTQQILVLDHSRVRFGPIRPRATLPPEILGEIFICCVEKNAFYPIDPNPEEPPLLFTRVCRWWKEVALSTPALWNSLSLDFDLMLKNEASVVMYQNWLSRAQSTLLSLSLVDIDEREVPPGPVASLLRTMVGMSHRWQSINLDLGQDVVKFLFPIKGTFPVLERLALSVHRSDIPTFICDAPKLRKLYVNTYAPQIQVPWCQLTSLRVGDIDLLWCLHILRDSSNLLKATVEMRCDPVALPNVIVEHSYLQNLAFGVSLLGPLEDKNTPMPILGCLKTPALKSLTLEFLDRSEDNHTGPIAPFLSFLSRPSIRLHTLGLSCMPVLMDDLLQCLQAVPSLVQLRLRPILNVVNLDPLFSRLTGQSDFLPQLELFHLVLSLRHTREERELPPITMTPSVVVQMLCWRWASSKVPLRSFRLAQPYKVPVGQAIKLDPEFQRLAAEGMMLYIGERDRSDIFL